MSRLFPLALLGLVLSLTSCDLSGSANERPVAAFSASIDRLTVSFTNESYDPDGNLQSVRWTLGPDTSLTTPNPVYTFAEAASYEIRLTVTDNEGATTTRTRTLSLTPSLDVFVANQGNFGDGNGSITVHDRDSSLTDRQALSNLSSIVQGIGVNEGRLFVAANSAGRVDLFAAQGYAQIGQLSGFSGPRYVTFPTAETAIVSNQSYSGPSSLEVLSLSGNTPQVATSIEVPGLPEGLATTDERVYAALGAFRDTTLVAAINSETRALEETIDVGCAPRFVLADAETDVYAVCSNEPALVRLDAASGETLGTVSLPDTVGTAFGVGQAASIAPGAHELYVVSESRRVFRVDTRTEEVVATIGPVVGDPIGGVAYDPERRELYLARVPGFSSQGLVTIHDRQGTQTGSFPAGVAPSYITLRRTGGMNDSSQ